GRVGEHVGDGRRRLLHHHLGDAVEGVAALFLAAHAVFRHLLAGFFLAHRGGEKIVLDRRFFLVALAFLGDHYGIGPALARRVGDHTRFGALGSRLGLRGDEWLFPLVLATCAPHGPALHAHHLVGYLVAA